MTVDQVEPVYQFEKRRATVRAYFTEFRGRRYAHIREFIEPRDTPGAPLVATKAGICVEVVDLDELQAAIAALLDTAAKSDTRSSSR